MARRKTHPNTNHITICVDDITIAALRAAAGLCQQELLDFVYSCAYDGVLTVESAHKTPLPISVDRVQPCRYGKARKS